MSRTWSSRSAATMQTARRSRCHTSATPAEQSKQLRTKQHCILVAFHVFAEQEIIGWGPFAPRPPPPLFRSVLPAHQLESLQSVAAFRSCSVRPRGNIEGGTCRSSRCCRGSVFFGGLTNASVLPPATSATPRMPPQESVRSTWPLRLLWLGLKVCTYAG